jgi:hypothetical protein
MFNMMTPSLWSVLMVLTSSEHFEPHRAIGSLEDRLPVINFPLPITHHSSLNPISSEYPYCYRYENFPMMPRGGLLHVTSGACAATVVASHQLHGTGGSPSSCAVCRGAAVGGTWERQRGREAERQRGRGAEGQRGREGSLVLLEKRL